MKLNEKISSLRRKYNFTQEKLAEMLSVSTAAVSKWECGISYPDIVLLPKLAEIFDCSIDFLMDYDMTCRKSITTVISEANCFRKEAKYDEAIAVIAQALSHYPGENELIFELARHKFIAARYKAKEEREKLEKDAVEKFEYISSNDKDDRRRAWALHYLSQIYIGREEYRKASYYNKKLLGVREIYPRITQAIIETAMDRGEKSYNLISDIIYECIFEYSLAVSWGVVRLFEQKKYDLIIHECTRAATVFNQFTDFGLLYHDISCCYETAALAYAKKEMYEECMEFLEKACEFAVLYDAQDIESKHNRMSDVMLENEVEFSSCRSMLQALNSSERNDYNPIRSTERFKSMEEKLNKNRSL